MKSPNIIFILLDDFGWTDLACYGSTFYETPNVDKLFRESMHFTDAYAACPVCSPTRASIMSGKYPANVGVTNYIGKGDHRDKALLIDAPYTKELPLSEKSLAAALREGGYTTWHVGKWHLGEKEFYPEKHGFDVNVAGSEWSHPRNGYFSPWDMENLENGPDGEYLTDRLTDEAASLIRNNKEKPFFLYMSYYTVHTPIQAKEDYISYFENKARSMGLDRVATYAEGEIHPKSKNMNRRVRRRLLHSDPAYAAMIKSMDENVGRLLQTLEETGQTENTIIFFTSDNGGLATSEGSPTCNAPLAEGKGWMYDGGTREPLIVKWPGVTKAGSVCPVPVTSPDFYPTILEMAGLEPIPEQHEDGVSITALLKGGDSLERDAIFWHYPHYGNQGGTPGASVRAGDWKLIEFFEDNCLELYNLRQDISEERNIADKHPEITDKLYTMLQKWQNKMGAKFPEENPEWPWK